MSCLQHSHTTFGTAIWFPRPSVAGLQQLYLLQGCFLSRGELRQSMGYEAIGSSHVDERAGPVLCQPHCSRSLLDLLIIELGPVLQRKLFEELPQVLSVCLAFGARVHAFSGCKLAAGL